MSCAFRGLLPLRHNLNYDQLFLYTKYHAQMHGTAQSPHPVNESKPYDEIIY